MSYINALLFDLAWPWPLVIIATSIFLIALIVFLLKQLDLFGAFFAFVMGTVILWSMRFEGFLLFLLFYISCHLIGSKKEERNSFQVLANGFFPTLCAVLYLYSKSDAVLVMFASSVAEATSDTFAGEIGRRSKTQPVSILTGKKLEKGISGGVTLLGFAGGFLGSMLISFFALLFFKFESPIKCVSLILISSFVGCVFDSLLGSWAQALYKTEDGKYTEKRFIKGKENVLVKGSHFIDNNMVNFISNCLSVILSLSFFFL